MSALVIRERGVQAVLKVPGNSRCVDCGAPNPEWASINLGVVMCLDCSGIHRSLGTHISKVRSLTLDVDCWHGELLEFILSVGNRAFNSYWEAAIPPGTLRPGPHPNAEPNATATGIRETFIRDKYQYRVFFRDRVAEEGCVLSPSPVPPPDLESWHLGCVYGPMEATMEKMAGRPFMATWQQRTLRLDPERRTLQYFKAGCEEEQGEVQLEGATVDLDLDNSMHPSKTTYLWRITPNDKNSASRKGKGYVFNATSARERVRWVENTNRCAENQLVVQEQEAETVTRPIRTAMSTVQSVYREMALKHVAEGELKKGTLCIRIRPSWGQWHNHFVCLTTRSLLIFATAEKPRADDVAFSTALIALPLQHIHVDVMPLDAAQAGVQLPGELQEESPAHVCCFWSPLAVAVAAFEDSDHKDEWCEAVKAAKANAGPLDFRELCGGAGAAGVVLGGPEKAPSDRSLTEEQRDKVEAV